MKPKQASKFFRMMDSVTKCCNCHKSIRVGRNGVTKPTGECVCDNCAGVVRGKSGQIADIKAVLS